MEYRPNPELLGRKRFPDDKIFRADLWGRAANIQGTLQNLLASNYPKSTSTNLSQLYRIISREFARIQYDIDSINSNKEYTRTKPEYLNQILGERLFLRDRIAPENYNDSTYRNYLIAIKDAFLRGSSKDTIESLASLFSGQTVLLKELYKESRKDQSFYGVVDTHKMLVEIYVDSLEHGFDIASFSSSIEFFIGLVRPAHVLYDTRFIWSDTIDINKTIDVYFGDTGGGCVPVYDVVPLQEQAVFAKKILVLPNSTGATGFIDSIQVDKDILFLADETRVILDPGVNGTIILGLNGLRISLSDLYIGQWVAIESISIPGNFQFWRVPDFLTNPNLVFSKEIFRLPAFQENVKKVMDAHGRFPLQIRSTETTLCDRWVQDTLIPLYEDFRRDCSVRQERSLTYEVRLSEKMWYPRFSFSNLQGVPTGREFTGDIYSFTVPNVPLTDGSGSPASPSDITVTLDGTVFSGAVESVFSDSGVVQLYNTEAYWESRSPVIGTTVDLDYWYSHDGTDIASTSSFVFGVSHWQLPGAPVSTGTGSNTLASPNDIQVTVEGIVVENAVSFLNPVLGHVTLHDLTDFWISSSLGRIPRIGDSIELKYFKSGSDRYTIIFDDLARTYDAGMVLDGVGGGFDYYRLPVAPVDPLTIGYRYRAYHLHHSSVLNSSDTLLLNNSQIPANRVSLANRQDTLNHSNIFFSPEFLTDTNSNIVLDDQYLENGLEPVLRLNAGTPPFQKTYGFHSGIIHHQKLQDIRSHRHPLMYSDLIIREFREGNSAVSLSSICDLADFSFRFQYREALDHLSECEPWIILDTFGVGVREFTIPGDTVGEKNLRVPGKKLRQNFILRSRILGGTFLHTYSIRIGSPIQTKFYLPGQISYSSQDYGTVMFPGLPIMKNTVTLADPDDVEIYIDGIPAYNAIVDFNPLTGYIELKIDPYRIVEYVSLTEENIRRGFIVLRKYPLEPKNVILNSIAGPPQWYGIDFFIDGNVLIFSELKDTVVEGELFRIEYTIEPLADVHIEFKYRLLGTSLAEIVNPERSRILDSNYIFPGTCYNEYKVCTGAYYKEYVNYLDDFSDGIKISYFNKDTYQIEHHIFSGPVFESFDPNEDEISSSQSFPGALVRIKNPINSGNPLKLISDYSFVRDVQIRIRKKRFRELLPDRSFRDFEISEVLPV